MPLNLKNLSYIRSLSFKEAPNFGLKLAELITSMSEGIGNIEMQTNSNATGTPAPPPAINSLHVTANDGHFQVAINHEGADFYRSPRYFVEHSASPAFTDPHVEELGATRNASLFLGNTTRYFRAYASYDSSQPGPIAYHGGPNNPMPVTGGGSIPGPNFSQAQGSGTGTAGQGHTGVGPIPFRTKTGGPPIR